MKFLNLDLIDWRLIRPWELYQQCGSKILDLHNIFAAIMTCGIAVYVRGRPGPSGCRLASISRLLKMGWSEWFTPYDASGRYLLPAAWEMARLGKFASVFWLIGKINDYTLPLKIELSIEIIGDSWGQMWQDVQLVRQSSTWIFS